MAPNSYYRLAKSYIWLLALFSWLVLGAGAAHAQTLRVEAESYNNAYDTTSGNEFTDPISSCTYNGLNVDVANSSDGTCKLGYTASGEWLEYSVTVPTTGAYRLSYRYSSGNTGSVGQITIKSNGTTLATTSLTDGKGDWDTYTTQYTTVSLSAGTQTIRLEFNSPVFDLNWFELEYATQSVPATGETRIETESYLSASDTTSGNSSTAPANCTYYGQNVDIGDTTDGGGCTVGYTASGEWLEYSINVAEADTYTLRYRWGSGNSGSLGTAYFKVNGSTLATTNFSGGTGSWELYTTLETTVSLSAGIQTVRLEWNNPQINMNWFSLEKGTSSGGGSGPGTCSFPSAGAVSVDSATVEVQGGGYIHDTPDNQLVAKNISVHADSCGSGVACTKTDTVAPLFTDVPSIPGGTAINIGSSGTQSISPGDYGAVTVGYAGTLYLEPGTYTFNGNVYLNTDAKITLSSPGVTKVYINGRLDTSNNSRVNTSGASGTETLVLYTTSEIALQSATISYMVAYSKARITVQNNATHYGALTSENYVVLNYGANVYYDETMVTSSGYGTGCGSASAVPTAAASWQMEQNWWDGTSGEVTDSGSTGLNGTATYDGSRPRVGRAVPAISGDPGTCHYAELTGQGYIRVNDPGSGSVLDATDFTVAAWIYPTEYPSSDVYTIMQKGQMFELHLLPSGGFRTDWYDGSNWQVFSPSGTAPLNTWSHVVYSFANGEQKLYINGVLQSTGSTATGYSFDDEPLVIGYDLYPNTRGFIGRIDEAGFFNYRLSASEVTALYGDTHDCAASTNYAVAQWAFDETSWAGTNGEVTDASGNGNHATAYSISGFPDTSNTFPAIAGDPGTCRYGDFYLGNDGYVSIGDSGFTDFDSPELTLSAWVMPKAIPSGSATIIRKGSQYELVIDASGIVSFRWQNDGTWNSLSAPSAITLNAWSHVALSFATGAQSLYIDGAEVANSAITKAFTLNDENVVVGYDFTTVTEAFDGLIDEVQIYANVLTATDINALSIATRSGCPSNGFEDCQAIFPDGASHSTTGKLLSFESGARISGSPDNILDVGSIYDGGSVTCETIDCTVSGSIVDPLTPPSFSGGTNVVVARNGSATISPGHHGGVTVKIDASLTFSEAGDYYINGNMNVDTGATISFSEEGTTRIYINGVFIVNEGVSVNSGAGDSKHVFLYTVGNVVLSESSASISPTFDNMVIYSAGEIQLNANTVFNGALTAAGDIRLLSPNVDVNYDTNIIGRMDFTGTSCAPTTATTNLVAEWRFDEASQWNGTSNELADSSGNNLHGSAQTDGGYPERKTANPAQGNSAIGTCGYADLSNNDGYFEIADPGTGSLFDLPSNSTYMLWARISEIPSGTTNPTIFYKGGQAQINLVKSTAKARYWWQDAVSTPYSSDSTTSLGVGTWHHIAVTRDSSSQKIYIDGVLESDVSEATAAAADNAAISIGRHGATTGRAYAGAVDEVRIYDGPLSQSEIQTAMAETRTCDATIVPTSIDISASTSASTCVPHSISLSVKNSLGNVITGYTGTVTLSTSTGNGDWSKTGTASDAYGTLTAGGSDSGSATYTFDSSDNGTITLLLASERTETVTVSAVESVNAASGNSSAISYTTNSYRKTDVTGGVRVVGYPQVWQVEMMAKDPSTGECSVNTGYSQTGVRAWLTRGANDPGGTAPSLVDSATSASVSLPNSEPGSNNFNLTFVNGVAEFTVNTTDVLQATLHIADKTRSFADVDLAMDTGEQTYGPFGFDISVTGNPAAASAGGAAFQSAGQNFTVTARAVAWQAADDLDNNKIPDNHASSGQSGRADLSDNNALVSFGQESPAETLTLSASLLLPAGGTHPGLGDGDASAADARVLSSFTAGSASTSQVYFDEVGIIEIIAAVSDNDYLGIGGDTANSQSYSATVGRFIPANFNFGGNSLTEACQSGLDFSYLGQSFSGEFTVTPKSTLGTSLQNYTGSFIKLSTGDFDFAARDLLSATGLTSRLTSSVDSLSFSSGVGTANATFTLARASSPDGPFTQVSLGTDFSDSDGAALATSDKDLDSDGDSTNDEASLGETELRFGRLRLGNAHGPETAALSVPMVVEYWSSPDWLVNNDDSCSQIERAEINYPDGTINFSSNRTITVGGSSTTGSYSAIVGDAVQFTEGDSGLSFSAPGTGNMASFSTGVDLTNYPWLRFDWDGDGSYTDTAVPDNTVNFGSYRGHDRMIFWQEY